MADMTTRPTSISFDCHTKGENFRAFVAMLLDRMKQCGLPDISRWQSDDETDGIGADLSRAVSALPASAARARGQAASINFELSNGVLGSARFYPDQGGVAFCSTNLEHIVSDEDSAQGILTFQNQCLCLCKELLRRVSVYSAELRADGDGVRCLPEVPLVDGASHIVVADRKEATRVYDEPDVFWNAGWTTVAEHEGRSLLARDMDVVCGPEYLTRIIDHQWAMARAAKPHKTRYGRPEVLPEEEPIFKAGEARLQGVGYSAEERLLEYSCALNSGEHIQGWEVYALLNIIEQGRVSDGSPVETVRVVFLDQWAAEQEKRPLLDIGCRVYHYDAEGELLELTE